MEYKKYNCNSYNIHTIKTDKFKTVRMEIIFSRDAVKEEMPAFTFLSDLLSDCSKKYPSRKEIAIRLEELYKTIFYGTTSKVGNLFTTSFVLEFINPSYINEDNYLEEVLKFPFEVINNPLVTNQEFDLSNFNIVKKRIIEEIKSIKEVPDKLAITNALKKMDEASPSSYKVLGEIEDINRITPASLYKTYEDLFNHSICDIFIIGNINMDKVSEIIKKNFTNHVIKLNRPNLLVNNTPRKKVLKVAEPSNFVQSTLVMIYNINNLDKDLKDMAFHIFNYILGSGGITSKLYTSLRSEHSLCYSVRSLYLKHDELLIIEVSLDDSNISLAEKLIRKCLMDMIKGNFTEENIEDAKKNLTFALKMSSDNNVSILNNYVFHTYDNLPLLDDRIKMINKVCKNDLLKCGASLSINTIYVQKAGDKNEGN